MVNCVLTIALHKDLNGVLSWQGDHYVDSYMSTIQFLRFLYLAQDEPDFRLVTFNSSQ